MRRFFASSILLLALVSLALGDTENSILMLTPQVWQCDPFLTQKVLIDFVDPSKVGSPDDLQLTLTMTSTSNSQKTFTLPIKTNVLNGLGLRQLGFQIPVGLEPGRYDLKLVAKSASYDFTGTFDKIDCLKQGTALYVLTDKPVYRDSDLVRMRVVYIDRDLIPISGSLASIFVTDPKDNRIQQFLDQKFDRGLISGLQLQLTERPIYGQWKIRVETDGINKEATFEVKEYVLPKFDFSIEMQPYIIKSAKSLDARIEAKYTYGKPLEGLVNVQIRNEAVNTVIADKQFELANGVVKLSLDLSIPDSVIDKLKMKVVVFDRYSLTNMTKEVPIQVFKEEFYVKDKTQTFIQGKLNTLKITLFERNDKPYANRNMNVDITQVNKLNSAEPKKVFESKQLNSLATDISGNLFFDLNVGADVETIEIKLSPISSPDQRVDLVLMQQKPDTSQTKLMIQREEPVNVPLFTASLLKLKLVKVEPNSAARCVKARYMVLGKLQVLNAGAVELCDETSVEIKLTFSHAPSSTFFAYFLDVDKNLRTSTFKIEMSDFYQNNLLLGLGRTSEVKPGDIVEVNVRSSPDSIVAISIVDKSVELMGNSNELTTDLIVSQASSLSQRPVSADALPKDSSWTTGSWWSSSRYRIRRKWNRPNELIELHNQGLAVASDVKNLKGFWTETKDPIFWMPFWRGIGFGRMASPIMGIGGSFSNQAVRDPEVITSTPPKNPPPPGPKKSASVSDNTQIRTDLREVWIWDTVSIGKDMSATIRSKIPETITSWVASGFSLNPDLGLAITNKKQISTFKPLFISTFLPPSMIRGEVLDLQVTVFNYLDQDLNDVNVTFSQNKDFLVLENGRLVSMSSPAVRLIAVLPKQTATQVKFVVSPVNVGQLTIPLKAESSVAGDGEVKFLKVKAEGIEQFDTQGMILSSADASSAKNLKPTLPSEFVKGSELCSIQIIGEVIGPAFNNLGNLIRKPYGCGEQNMVNFVPNINALDYLLTVKDTRLAVPNWQTLEKSARENILDGYQRQLTYARDDGSFSAFGKSDKTGSTWLTAFVIKSFIQAKKYALIDEQVIRKAVDFLIKQQEADGSFSEKGRVLSQALQGGVESKQTLTAYVTSALAESQLKDEAVQKAINSAVVYLEGAVASLTDTFSLVLVANALDLAKSSQAGQVVARFDSKATRTQDGVKFWSSGNDQDIDLNCYGLLLMLRQKPVSDVASIVKHLIKKMSPSGGFSSTQSTVLGLQALTNFALESLKLTGSEKERNLKVAITVNGKDPINFSVTDQNAMVLQMMPLPDCSSSALVQVSGTGSALVQLVSSYNVPSLTPNANFALKQTTLDSSPFEIELRTCVSNQGAAPTGMTLVEADLLSGYEVNKAEMDKLPSEVADLQKVEIKDKNKVVFYLNGLEPKKEICIYWMMHKAHEVTGLKSVPVKVYDYYNPTLEASFTYEPPLIKQNVKKLSSNPNIVYKLDLF